MLQTCSPYLDTRCISLAWETACGLQALQALRAPQKPHRVSRYVLHRNKVRLTELTRHVCFALSLSSPNPSPCLPKSKHH